MKEINIVCIRNPNLAPDSISKTENVYDAANSKPASIFDEFFRNLCIAIIYLLHILISILLIFSEYLDII
jgi:hypothetical protein